MATFPVNRSSLSRLVYCFLLVLVGTAALHGYEQITYERAVDWRDGSYSLLIDVELEGDELFLPSIRHTIEQDIFNQLPRIMQNSIADFPVDSAHTVRDYTEENPLLTRTLEELAHKGVREYSHLSKDMTSFKLKYRYNLYPDIISLFVEHTYNYKPARFLHYEPTNDFWGLVIYARGEYPVHGEDDETAVVPSLFPRIYDENMNLILEKGMLPPKVLYTRGVAAYTEELNERRYLERIGYTPLRTIATGVFGINRTDIIIPNNAARKLLTSDHNRSMLQEGRILIICELPENQSG